MFSQRFVEFLRRPESLQIQGNSCKASNSRNKQTNATTKNKGSQILQADLISAKQKTWKHILCLKGIIMWYHVRKGVFPTSLAAFFWLGL